MCAKFETNPREDLLRCVRSVVRSWQLKNIRGKNGCSVSSIGMVDLLFGFKDSIKSLLC